jgi:hypothetical protein
MFIRALILAAASIVGTPSSAATSNGPLAREVGKTRPLIVITSSAADPILVRLKNSLRAPDNRRAFAERDMVLFTVIDGHGQRDGSDMSVAATTLLIDELRLRQGPLPRLILIGKDGRKKLERHGPIELKKLFGIIDAMPMRQDELGRDDAARSGKNRN